MMKHIGWDFGSLFVLGALVRQQTIKAACARRVAFAAVVERETAVTCPDCLAAIRDREAAAARMRASLNR